MRSITGLTDAARAAGMKHGGYMPVGMIRWRVDQLHVGTSVLTVAREFWHKRAAKFPRPIKRATVRVALRIHLQNRTLYNDVVNGWHR